MVSRIECLEKIGSRYKLLAAMFIVLISSQAVFSQNPEIVVQRGLIDSDGSAAFSPDGKTLASAGEPSRIISIFQIESGRELRTLTGHTGAVYHVTYSPDGKTLASGGDDKTVRIWDIVSGEAVRVLDARPLRRVVWVAFSPDGSVLAAAGYNNQKGAGSGTIKLWDAATGKELPSPSGHELQCNTLAFTPDGKTLASGGEDNLIKLWDIATGKELRTLKGHAEPVGSVAVSPDGKMLASGGGKFVDGKDYAVRIWDIGTGRLLRTIKGFSSVVVSLAFSPTNRILAGADSSNSVLWDSDTWQEVLRFPGESSAINWVGFSPDGRTLGVGQFGPRLILREVATGKVTREFKGHSQMVSAVAFSPSGKTLITGALVEKPRIWNTPAGIDCLTSKDDSNSFAISPDARSFLDSFNGKIVRRGLDTGIETGVFAEGEPYLEQILFSPDGGILAGFGRADFEELRYKAYTIKLWDAATGRDLRSIKSGSVQVFRIAFSPDGKTLAGGGLTDNRLGNQNIKLWDVATGRELRTLAGHEGRCDAIAFSPDGKMLASGAIDNLIKLWDPATGKEIRTLSGHTGWMNDLAFAPDGKTLVSASDDGTIRLWDTGTGKQLRMLKGHTDRVIAIDISPDGRFLASGSQDGTTRLWDMSSGKDLAALIALDENDWLVITPDGLFDGSPAAWDQILWRFARNTFDVVPVEAFFNEYFYPGLLADILSGKKVSAVRDIQQLDRRQPELKLAVASGQPLPESGSTARSLAVKLVVTEAPSGKGQAAGSGARDVRLFRNGSLVRVWRGDVLKGGSQAVLEANVSMIAGENRLIAYAFNRDNIKSANAALVVKGADELRREGTAYVIAVGVNQYANREFDLKYAVADAQAFGAEFEKAQSGLGRFAKTEVITLLNEAGTKANLLRALDRLAGRESAPLAAGDLLEKIRPAQPEDAVFVYFSGHGTVEQGRFYLIPHDLGYTGGRDELGRDQNAMRLLCSRSISDVELEQAFEKIDSDNLLLVIDACHSGQALESEEKRRGPINSRGLAQLAYEKGMYVLTASQSYQVAVGSKRLGHGYLTYALVEEGLKTNRADQSPADGQVLIREWLDYTTRRVPDMQNDESKEIRDLVQPEAAAGKKSVQARQDPSGEVQRPRVFYRREPEAQPLIIVRP